MPTIWFFSAINKLTPVVIRIAMKGSDLPKEGRAVIETERDASMGGLFDKTGTYRRFIEIQQEHYPHYPRQRF